MQQEINNLLEKDAENKALEREYLEEIRIAEQNNDQEAFKFYLSEYVKVERLKLPDWIKTVMRAQAKVMTTTAYWL